ncbi:MAG TPA: DNA-binding protein WhiA [Ruminiclostridium sp.]|nr:DNA-binding protein WhiA [Ruminiclostridium sp.]
MSFSTFVKDELCRVELHHDVCCMKAEIFGVILTGNLFSNEKNNRNIKMVTENAAFARRTYSTVRKVYGISPEVAIRRSSKLKKHVSYSVIFASMQLINKILYDFGITAFSENENNSAKDNLRKVCCKKSFLRAAFLSGGSISDPEKTYHLEISTRNNFCAELIKELLQEYGINAKIIVRKGNYVTYIKEGENIVDFLNIIGAHGALMELENVRILKDMRNSVNRIVNCETANLEKTVNASVRQMENIRFIQSSIGIDKLPENLIEIANLRLEYSDASLKELGEMLHPKLGKSGVNHRLRKLDEIAEQVRDNLERKYTK